MRETDSEREKGKGVSKGQKEILVNGKRGKGAWKQMRRCVPLHVQKKKSYREENISREVRLLR